MMKTDWHIHTTASDGAFSPVEIIQKASAAGLDQIAISDHDTLFGWRKASEFKGKLSSPLYLFPAIEFGADVGVSEEVHIVGYGINPNSEEIEDYLSTLKKKRRDRFDLLLEKIKKEGYQISDIYLEPLYEADARPGRLHLGKALVEEGYFPSVGAAFDCLLSSGKPAYVPAYRYSLEEICKLIHENEGISVLAHPYQISSQTLREDLLKSQLIDGIEAFYPTHDENEIKELLHFCREYEKYASGGSDFHGVKGRYPEELGIFIPPIEGIKAFVERINDSPYQKKIG